jgi:hypothetical protein
LAPTPDVREVRLHLLPGRSLEADYRLLLDALVRREQHLELRHSAAIAART